jgi:hypothetical protein
MSEGAVKDYGSGEKKAWREWQWSRIADLFWDHSTPTSDALVVGLFGVDGRDLEIAGRKGFRRENMIAVEREPQAVISLRNQGITTIKGDLNDVLSGWNTRGRPIDVVLADFCGGATWENTGAFCRRLMRCVQIGSIVSVNLQRGREHLHDIQSIRTFQEQWFDEEARNRWNSTWSQLADHHGSARRPFLIEEGMDKHRGVYFYAQWVTALRETYANEKLVWKDRETGERIDSSPDERVAFATTRSAMYGDPAYSTYRSFGKERKSALYFDSVVFRVPLDPRGPSKMYRAGNKTIQRKCTAALALVSRKRKERARRRKAVSDGPMAKPKHRPKSRRTQ